MNLSRESLEPSLTKNMTAEQLEGLLEEPLRPKLLCLTQSAERIVKSTTRPAV